MNRIWALFLKPRSWIASLLLIALAAGFYSLDTLDYMAPVKDILDSEDVSLKVGETRISAYLFIKGVLTIVMLIWLTGIFSQFGERRIKALRGIKTNNKALITKAFQIWVYFLAFIIGLNILGIDLTALAVFSGAIGIGIGFGLQKITANFISGLILLFENSIENGDLVELADGTSGFVRHTSARYTLIESFGGKEVMIPNDDFIANRVINWTYSNNRARIDISVGVSYDSDIDKASALILEAAREHPRCAADPAPACFMREFADSSINFLLMFWVEDVRQGRYGPHSDVMKGIWQKFRDNGIAIPYPQHDIYIKNSAYTKDSAALK